MNEIKPEISVVMPVFNAGKYINEAIESMLIQTFENFELIIVNDCSSDGTGNILNLLKDRRIAIINNLVHEGNFKSRNKGLEISRGKYICVMDADDISMPERLEKQYHFMEENGQYAVIGTDMVVFGENIKYSRQKLRNPEDIKVHLLQNTTCAHPSLMIRRDFLQQNNIRYNEDYYYAADYNLLVEISRTGNITNLPKFLLHYRRHPEQISFAKYREQSMYRDRIQLKQLENFKVRPSIDEVIIHHALMNGLQLSGKQLEATEKWCNRLIMKNHKLRYYDEDCLLRFLEDRLLTVIKNAN